MRIISFITLTALITFVSCKGKIVSKAVRSDDKVVNVDSAYKTLLVQKSDAEEKSSFDEFFLLFGSVEEYQVEHIIFPLNYLSFDTMDNVDTLSLKKEDWEFNHFAMDTVAYQREHDRYKPELIRERQNYVTYIRRGIDNGILIEYHFVEDAEAWKMFQIIDKSN